MDGGKCARFFFSFVFLLPPLFAAAVRDETSGNRLTGWKGWGGRGGGEGTFHYLQQALGGPWHSPPRPAADVPAPTPNSPGRKTRKRAMSDRDANVICKSESRRLKGGSDAVREMCFTTCTTFRLDLACFGAYTKALWQ